MTRKPRSTISKAAPANQALAPALPGGQIIEILESKEVWSEYKLADGSVLRVRPIVMEVRRYDDQITQEGEPLYQMSSGMLPHMRVNPKLKK